ncbi:MAG: DUF2207 domain-containing protein [Patescibacteria group bacterium]|jgi:uncharacterized membrane protein YgcG
MKIKPSRLAKISFFCILAFLFLLTPALAATATQEKIDSLDSQIKVNPDSTLLVTETIVVDSLGIEIKRGIYRDFPTIYDNGLAKTKIGFDLISVTRDGQPESYHYGSLKNGIRIYLGKSDYELPPGTYTYQLTYRVNRELGFFNDHDELYWNVTGNGWVFPILKASATVILPDAITADQIKTDGYTGLQGAKDKNFTAQINNNLVTFTTTQSLKANEGLTIVVGWPKGFIAPPTAEQKRQYFWQDNAITIIGLIGLIVVFLYYLIAWIAVGKDPKAGTIIPEYEPPAGFSPAALRYIKKMGYDKKGLTANIINLAVKGVIQIKKNGNYTLIYNQADKTKPDDEAAMIIKSLFPTLHEIELKNTNYKKIGDATKLLNKLLKDKYQKVYFVTNIRFFLIGLLLTIGIIILATSSLSNTETPVIFLVVWLTGWTLGILSLLVQAIQNWKQASNGIIAVFRAIGSTFAFGLFFFFEIIAIMMLLEIAPRASVIIILLLIAINYIFYRLIKAPTVAGQKLLGQIAGFKWFLTVTEKDRLNFHNPPQKTPELFEKYLPYALALDVENQWAEQFNEIFAKLAEKGQAYVPVWYSGTGFNPANIGTFAGSLGGAFASAVSSSANAPGSSSGFGGGGSGGGGGGGGGGGW